MNKRRDFVFVGMPVERAEREWCDFLTARRQLLASHQVVFIPAADSSTAGSFLVSSEIPCSGLMQILRKRWIERGIPTAALLQEFQSWQGFFFDHESSNASHKVDTR